MAELLEKPTRKYVGLSTEPKPTKAAPLGAVLPGDTVPPSHLTTGSTFKELDTGDIYMYYAVTDSWYFHAKSDPNTEILEGILLELQKLTAVQALQADVSDDDLLELVPASYYS